MAQASENQSMTSKIINLFVHIKSAEESEKWVDFIHLYAGHNFGIVIFLSTKIVAWALVFIHCFLSLMQSYGWYAVKPLYIKPLVSVTKHIGSILFGKILRFSFTKACWSILLVNKI